MVRRRFLGVSITEIAPVPAPPADFMLRVKHIEDHIIRLEKEYPPWAALHFNQPHRGVRQFLA
jgi:hypothetical protein